MRRPPQKEEGNLLDQQYAVIAENDITKWSDLTGTKYHYPARYRKMLQPGTRLIHYKGVMRDKTYAGHRLSPKPHYFAVSIAGVSVKDDISTKGDLYVDIIDFFPFPVAVPHRINGITLEQIPENRATNYWRDGVRVANRSLYNEITALAGVELHSGTVGQEDEPDEDGLTTSLVEGGKKITYSTRYERRPELRHAAVRLHGTTCFCCDLSMENIYGDKASGFIHIHHLKPLSLLPGPQPVCPQTDLVPVCPNCHAMIHLGGQLRSVDEIRDMLGKPPRS